MSCQAAKPHVSLPLSSTPHKHRERKGVAAGSPVYAAHDVIELINA